MNIYLPLISALAGALIGATASIITVIVQSHYQTRRELVKQAVSAAIEDWKTRLKIDKSALPMSVFIHYHTKLIDLAVQGRITPDAIRLLQKEQDSLVAVIKEANGKAPLQQP